MNYKGYPLFNETNDRRMQAYNRLQTMININEAMGEQQAQHYVEHFEDWAKKDLAIMAAWIKKDGQASVQRQLGNA